MLRTLAALLALACALSAHAGLFSDDEARAQVNTVRTQLDDLTRKLDSVTQSQVDFNNQIETIKADIAKLRGQIDELTYNLDAAQKRQKDFYVDLDNRLRKIEGQAQVQVDAKADAAKAADTAMHDYEAALTALKGSAYKEAAAGFEAFIGEAPNSPQQASAHFFAGYCYSRLKQPAKAVEMYRQLVANWPNDEHAPDALLEQANNLDAAGDRKEGRKTLEQLVEKYPASEAAKQAKARLKKK